ncbi:hypothetical protein WICPIJ_000059 [Wickerhamomyces pijperi]|uniref:Uncharacterized protein n=1 Tax=Wickerhamomyces pijperi TaxID=599730 RepID=A0A9P8QEI5_WICPI|nr:hypothetical protein WICPIJ_000059 [Wickerhamomyces pijperi]
MGGNRSSSSSQSVSTSGDFGRSGVNDKHNGLSNDVTRVGTINGERQDQSLTNGWLLLIHHMTVVGVISDSFILRRIDQFIVSVERGISETNIIRKRVHVVCDLVIPRNRFIQVDFKLA